MATNKIRDGKLLYEVTITGAESGDAFVVGDFLPCVLLTDADANDSHKATIQTEGVFELDVAPLSGGTASAVALGDSLFWTDKDTALSKESAQKFFGIALGTVGTASTAASAINVLITPKMAVPGEVGTTDLADKAVTYAKIQDLTSTNIIVGDSGNRPLNRAMSGDATLSNTGALTIGANKVTSAKTEVSLIQTKSLDLTAAQIKTLYSANSNKGIEVVAAASDKLVEFISAALIYDYDGTNAYTAANDLVFELEGTAVSPVIGSDSFLEATEDRVVIVQALSACLATLDTGLVGKGLFLTTDGTDNPTGSSSLADQLKVRVTYRVYDFS